MWSVLADGSRKVFSLLTWNRKWGKKNQSDKHKIPTLSFLALLSNNLVSFHGFLEKFLKTFRTLYENVSSIFLRYLSLLHEFSPLKFWSILRKIQK